MAMVTPMRRRWLGVTRRAGMVTASDDPGELHQEERLPAVAERGGAPGGEDGHQKEDGGRERHRKVATMSAMIAA
jgi:hypothetical protein